MNLIDEIMNKIKTGDKIHYDFQPYEDMYLIAKEKIKEGDDYAFKKLKDVSEIIINHIGEFKDEDIKRVWGLHKKILLTLARNDFDSFLLYIEWNRDPKSKFYVPRRKQLLPLVKALQDLEDDNLDLLAISMPPGTGKSTLAIFYLTWISGRHPNEPNLGGSHSNSFLRGVYDECLRIITGNGGEYLWGDVFPEVKLKNTNAKDMRIDLDKPQRFETLEFSSIGSGNAGKVRAMRLLYCDDLVDGIETAMSAERLNKLWQQYTTDLRQRKIGKCKELHIATRWSVHDVIGRLERQYRDNPRCKFIVCAALNENDESNFDYPCEGGFTTQMLREQRDIMDEVSWRALFMNEPIEREGLLYHEDELRRYFELPDTEPDAVIAVCDTKDRGSDYCVLPVAYVYGNDYYIHDCICDNGNPEIIDVRIWQTLVNNHVQMARFESNSAGGRVAKDAQTAVNEHGGICKITTKFTTANKETKIVTNSPFVKERFLFKDKSLFKPNTDYGKMMTMLCGYTMAGKNKHDDVPDAMAMLSDYAQSFGRQEVRVFNRPF